MTVSTVFASIFYLRMSVASLFAMSMRFVISAFAIVAIQQVGW
jgi:hypothetical protein